jgi:hypothetical protein
MTNSTTSVACAFLISLIFMASSPARGQESPTVPSLGEIARQLKAEREREKQKPVAVFTNDNLPHQGSLGIASATLEKGAQEEGQVKKSSVAEAAASEERGEKYFRSKAEKIRSQMEFHQRQLAVLKQELGLARMQYYPDPQKTLEQESTPAFQTDVDKIRAKITKTEEAVADDQKAMDNLQQELRREKGDPGWIR